MFMKREIGFFIILIIIVFLTSGCMSTRHDGEYLDVGINSDEGYFIVEKRVDKYHYIVSDPAGNKYYASRVKDAYYVIGGEYHGN